MGSKPADVIESNMSISNKSWASFSARVAELDFTATPVDCERFDKCKSFWHLVQNFSKLEDIMRTSDTGRKSTPKEREADVLKEKLEIEDDEDSQLYCLKKLQEINKAGIMKTALSTKLPARNRCTTNASVSLSSADDVAAISKQIHSWNAKHECSSIPESFRQIAATSTAHPSKSMSRKLKYCQDA